MKKMYNYYVYILTNDLHSVFYIGVTNNLARRIFEHKNGLANGFTKKYNLKYLIYFEDTRNINDALAREKQLKNWHRNWKINLVKSVNPTFKDLSQSFFDAETSSA
jgi:putative endonuclease